MNPTLFTLRAQSPARSWHTPASASAHDLRKPLLAAMIACILACALAASGCTKSTSSATGEASLTASDKSAATVTVSESSTAAVATSDSAQANTAETAAPTSSSAAEAQAEPYTTASRAGYDLSTAAFSQLIVVASSGTTATVTCYEKDAGGVFREVASIGQLAAVVGEGGVGTASEGSSVTPAGLFDIPFTFGNAENPGTKMEFLAVDENAWWSSEEGNGTYNAYVESEEDLGGNSERLADAGSFYDYAAVIGYNHPSIGAESPDAIEGAGSAFFLHIYDEPTEGCVGVSYEGMQSIMMWLDPASSPHILIV